jgi:DNA repair protein SbcC/Rad50
MKILKIRFKNLNSLYGEWEIDFTSQKYTANGIFSITGPTGAGKSTILDAICLALYARTPRLKAVNKNSNDIISRQTGECYAEVTFETQSGKYRCNWSQNKARKKPDGNLQNAHHEISDAETGKPLASQIKAVSELVEQKTGLDFERFTRSILLAQGNFAKFLQADPDTRAPILEQITGTEIYSLISIKVHEHNKAENDKLELLQAATSGIELLDPEEESLLVSELKNKQIEENKLTVSSKTLTDSINWLIKIDNLKKELVILETEAQTTQTALNNFLPEREKLQQANIAADLDSQYSILLSNRQQQNKDTENLQMNQQQIPILQESHQQKTKAVKAAETDLQNTKKGQETEQALIKEVRALDIILAEKQKNLVIAQENAQRLKIKLTANDKLLKKNTADHDLLRTDMQKITEYLNNNASDESLIADFTGIKEQLKALKKYSDELQEKHIEHQSQIKLNKKYSEAYEKLVEEKSLNLKAQKEAHENVKKSKILLLELLAGKLLREYRTQHHSMLREMAFLNKIASLESDRKNLQDNKPCPLCGSPDHPYALGNVPEIDETEKKIQSLDTLIHKADKLENEIKILRDIEKTADDKLHETELSSDRAKQQFETSNASISNLLSLIKLARTEKQNLEDISLKNLQKYGIKQLSETELNSILSILQQKKDNWLNMQEKKKDLDSKQTRISNDQLALLSIQTELKKQQKEINKTLQTCRDIYNDKNTERENIYGIKLPDKEEARWITLVQDAETKLNSSQAEALLASDKLKGISTTISNLKTNIDNRDISLMKLEPAFLSACQSAGFADEKIFISARLSADVRKSLFAKAQLLDHKKTEISARNKDCQNKLKIEKDKKLSIITLEDLQQQNTELQSKINELAQNIGADKQKLQDNQQAKIKLKDKQIEIDAQKKECTRWKALHILIGSADGKKFRNFAQGLTFELMIAQANQQLTRMNDRYLLVHDKEKPLELNVIDNYQAGEIRSTKNLSGGESFLVSLSLALGLSQMASRKVQVDSLFLDEGFGTLDEDALETALESLASLQQTGKLIGIISHVPALKERIPTQIKVIPQSGGKSQISGPGILEI